MQQLRILRERVSEDARHVLGSVGGEMLDLMAATGSRRSDNGSVRLGFNLQQKRLGARWMGSEPSLALSSQCCAPIRFLEAGFEYKFSKLRPALEDLCSS